MKKTSICKFVMIACTAALGLGSICPVSASALESRKTKENHPVSPLEITHNSRFDCYTKLDCVDVSVYQGKIDWQSVAAEGVDAAIVRAGFRSYDKGEIKEDKYFVSNLQNASDAGLQVGVYFYTQAVSVKEAQEEARYVLDMLEKVDNVTLGFPIYFDMEPVDTAKGRLDAKKLSRAEHTAICNAFCDVIEQNGYQAGIYSCRSFMEDHLNMDDLEYRSIWMASCGVKTSYKGKYDIWQYSHKSKVSGIRGTVDRNVIYTLAPAEMQTAAVDCTSDELEAPDLSEVQFAVEPF